MAEKIYGYIEPKSDIDNYEGEVLVRSFAYYGARESEFKQANDLAIQHRNEGGITMVGIWHYIPDLKDGECAYIPLTWLRKSMRDQIVSELNSMRQNGQTPVLIHIVRSMGFVYYINADGSQGHRCVGVNPPRAGKPK